VAFTVCNDTIFVATSRNFVLRHDTSDGSDAVSELELTKSPDARVRRLFVDPLGLHALVTVATGNVVEPLYIDRHWRKARPLPKLKGLGLTSVAWPPVLHSAVVTYVLG
jgi:hypothetical protein